MKIALIGKGKTGGEILNLHPGDQIQVFDSQNPVSVDKLATCDVAIAFVPGHVLESVIPVLIEANIPLVSGATGFTWPSHIQTELQKRKLSWISGSNFSLGMRIVHQMIKKLNLAKKLFDDYNFSIHEIHHTKKLDAPSGTAISWNEWVDSAASDITHERIGDVVGDHEMTLNTAYEKISLRHQALDRKIFAKGALWAANYLLKERPEPGLHLFEEITEKIINDNQQKKQLRKEHSNEL